MKYGQKEIFTANGRIQMVKDNAGKERKSFVPDSQRYLHDCLNRISPVGKPVAVTFTEHIATRSDQQLRYHFVLCGYIAEYTGHTKEEIHDCIMRIKFGTKVISLDGHSMHVRKSVAEGSKFPKGDMVELINYDLELCQKLEIVVPSAKELGYSTTK